MNILPKKSWHVRTKKNIDRVRRDEAKARDEEKQLEKRIHLAEQEARTDFLRKRARHGVPDFVGREPNSPSSASSALLVPGLPQHVDIFAGVEEGKGDVRKNREHEQEEKAEKEKWEKQVGLLTFLGQGEEEGNERPWYLSSHQDRMKISETEETEKKGKVSQKPLSETDRIKDMKVKLYHDPMTTMKRYMEQMKGNSDKSSKAKAAQKLSIGKSSLASDKPSNTRISPNKEIGTKTIKKHKKHKKHGKHSKKRKRRESSPSASSESESEESKRKKLEALRAERLQREKVERERSRQLVSKSDEKPAEVFHIQDERKRSYNSQFNPHLAKQNAEKQPQQLFGR